MSKKPIIRYTVIGICTFLIISMFLFGWAKGKGIDFPVWKVLLYALGSSVGLGVLGAIIWSIVSFVHDRYAGKGKGTLDIELPKAYVDNGKIPEIWKKACIVNTNIPHLVQTWNNDEIVPIREDVIKIMNSRSFSDPDRGTADRFYGFEALILEGNLRGLNVVITREDHGEEWIEKNWNWQIHQKKSWETFDLNESRYPLTSSKDESVRLAVKKMELAEEGYSEHEVRQIIDPLLKENQRPVVIQQHLPKPVPAIKSPSIAEHYPEAVSTEDEQVDLDDLKKDIEKYRRRNN